MTQSQAALSLADLSFAATISSIPQPQRNNSLPRLNSQQPLPQVPQAQNGAQKQQDQGPYHPPIVQHHFPPFSGNMTSFPPAEANHAIIQSTWSLFAAMEDNQRNQLLKGLLLKCSSKQVDLICTQLNLKMSEPTLPGIAPTVFATDAVGKFAPHRGIPASTSRRNIAQTPSRQQNKASTTVYDPNSIGALQQGRNIHFPHTYGNNPDMTPVQTLQHKHNRANHPQNAFMTPNLYIKLLNTEYHPQTLLKQIYSTNSLDTTRTLFEFLLQRTEKQQSLLKCMQSLSKEPIYEPPSEQLLKCALEVCGARDGTLILASTWAIKEAVLEGGVEIDCVLTVPVLLGGVKLVGAVEVINKKGVGDAKQRVSPYFNAEDDVWTILSGGTGLGGGVGGSASGTPGKKKDDIKMLMNTASFMSSDLDLNGLVRVVMQTAQELLSAERCALFIVDHKKKELWSSIPMSKGIAGYVATTGEVLNIPNAYQDPRFNRAVDVKTGFYTRNILCIPMKNSKNEVIGVAQLINKMPEPLIFTSEDEGLLTAFSSLAASTIEKNIVFQELQAMLDDTTDTKAHLAKTVNGLPHVIITLDSSGKMTSINHPEDLLLTPDTMDLMKYNSFDVWLGAQSNNTRLIEDIRKSFKGEEGVVGRDYDLILNGHAFIVNYTASEMIEPEEDMEGEEIDEEIKDMTFDFSKIGDEAEEPEDEEEEEDKDQADELEGDDEDYDDVGKKRQRKVESVVLSIEILDAPRRIKDAMLRHIPPHIVDTLVDDDVSRHAEGSSGQASAMSVDLRNFHSIHGRVDAKDTIFVLNMFHIAVHEATTPFNGLIDKITDEKASAVFGVPSAADLDAYNAVSAGLKLLGDMDEVNNHSLWRCGPPKRLDYVVMGEAVPIAARIQEATKVYGSKFLICDKTQREVREKFHFREIDHVKVKGSDMRITLFEVLGVSNMELAREVITSTICFELGLSEYRNQNYSVAQLHFKKAIQTTDDGPSKMFVQRCQDLLDGKYKVEADWDGCWKLEFDRE
ncbi:hypothetical protein BCR33DRAFT_714320 [Rhizoclosmatium globosum]|uniref:GAF domain-containing protein n=1 Tax=Rhizoclosmatium globosum TaxID=329046 RepID=A0A1Y2CNE7_9FUNG|nr:hypothetical protein BCR33DRAFT_714320 [Rhizoclosmatium globosum]|eukprot:ORY48560.1 hypothetical protein BCR33DRAFT_714320 [Rhizoclosmatium globosum]